MSRYSLNLPDEQATQALGARLAGVIPERAVVFLEGDLGAGKTTLARALLHALGHQGPVRSPTYTLVEPYRLPQRSLYHLDLYRLSDPEELEFLGLRDMLAESCVLMIEWPQRGRGVLPEPDLRVRLEPADGGRHVDVEAASELGEAVIQALGSR